MVPFNISGVNTTDINELLCAGENTIVLIKESGDVVFVYYSFDNEGIIEARSYGKPIEGLGVTGAFNVGDECVAGLFYSSSRNTCGFIYALCAQSEIPQIFLLSEVKYG